MIAAFVPLAYLLVASAAAWCVLAVRRDGARPWWRIAALVLGPLVLLAPWLPAIRNRPATLLLEAGLPGPGLSVPDLDGLDVLLLHPGGPGLPPLPLTVGLRARPRWPHCCAGPPATSCWSGWLIAVCSLVAAVGLTRVDRHAHRPLASQRAGLAGPAAARRRRGRWSWRRWSAPPAPAPGWPPSASAGASRWRCSSWPSPSP